MYLLFWKNFSKSWKRTLFLFISWNNCTVIFASTKHIHKCHRYCIKCFSWFVIKDKNPVLMNDYQRATQIQILICYNFSQMIWCQKGIKFYAIQKYKTNWYYLVNIFSFFSVDGRVTIDKFKLIAPNVIKKSGYHYKRCIL